MQTNRRLQTSTLLTSIALLTTLAAACSSQLSPDDAGGQGGGPIRGGNGGTSGSGGGSGAGGASGGASCESLMNDYAAAFAAARGCSPFLDNVQCGSLASPTLECPNCPQHVSDTTQLDAIRTAYFARTDCPRLPCPAFLCVSSGTGVCQPSDAGGSPGTCADIR